MPSRRAKKRPRVAEGGVRGTERGGGGGRRVRLADGLHDALGGRRYCLDKQITPLLLARGRIKQVTTFQVVVTTLEGLQFECKMDETECSVRALRRYIQQQRGVRPNLQELFLTNNAGNENTDNDASPLQDADMLPREAAVLLCIRTETLWQWDDNSDLITDNNNTDMSRSLELDAKQTKVTKTGFDEDINNTMVVKTAMQPHSGKYWISFNGMYDLVGVVQDGDHVLCDVNYAQVDSQEGWFIDKLLGELAGNGHDQTGNCCPDFALNSLDVLTLELDTDLGTLKFFVNGKIHGPGFTGVTGGPMRWAVSLWGIGDFAQIVPNPELET